MFREEAGSLPTALRLGTRAMQATLLAVALYTAATGQFGPSANTAIMLLIALVPDGLRFRTGYQLNPVLTFLIALSPFLHAIGALGPYQTIPMFDQVAHTVSASLVAGAGYVVVNVVDEEYDEIEIPSKLRFVFVLVFASAFGVIWEIAEFGTGLVAAVVGGEPLLAQYGLDDVVLDLLFNSVGAVVVAIWGTGYFDGVRRLADRRVDGSRGDDAGDGS